MIDHNTYNTIEELIRKDPMNFYKMFVELQKRDIIQITKMNEDIDLIYFKINSYYDDLIHVVNIKQLNGSNRLIFNTRGVGDAEYMRGLEFFEYVESLLKIDMTNILNQIMVSIL